MSHKFFQAHHSIKALTVLRGSKLHFCKCTLTFHTNQEHFSVEDVWYASNTTQPCEQLENISACNIADITQFLLPGGNISFMLRTYNEVQQGLSSCPANNKDNELSHAPNSISEIGNPQNDVLQWLNIFSTCEIWHTVATA